MTFQRFLTVVSASEFRWFRLFSRGKWVNANSRGNRPSARQSLRLLPKGSKQGDSTAYLLHYNTAFQKREGQTENSCHFSTHNRLRTRNAEGIFNGKMIGIRGESFLLFCERRFYGGCNGREFRRFQRSGVEQKGIVFDANENGGRMAAQAGREIVWR